ncbi:hypothetical protein B0H10DRAFT_2219327 [Mycena sp. CBHHK59/15]|nr:hypothetical protein B0H10DRAFT_2219327 [Mycena sp. CBHHK59/15]
MQLLGVDLRDGFDGTPIPPARTASMSEHIDMEYWGNLDARNEGNSGSTVPTNNTYKSARVIWTSYNLYYTVWCDHNHELYDMTADPYQMTNLLSASNATDADITSSIHFSTVASSSVVQLHMRRRIRPQAAVSPQRHPQLVSRLDMVLKSCKADAYRSPWNVLHPRGNVQNLEDAMASEYDSFYASQPKVSLSECHLITY